MIKSIFMTGSVLVFSFLFLTVFEVAAEEKKAGAEMKISPCHCYTTEALSWKDFLTNEDTINTIESKCKKGYFMNGFRQSAETKPQEFGQYILIESIDCCKLCEE